MGSDWERDRDYARRYNTAHHEQRREYNRRYAAEHRDAIRARVARRRQELGIAKRGSPEYHLGRVLAGTQAGKTHHARFLERHAGHEIVNGQCASCLTANHTLAKLRHRACSRGVPCTLTTDDVRHLLTQVGQPCPLCDIIMVSRGSGEWSAAALSIDRLDNAFGYEPGNVWALCWKCNARKRDASLAWLQRLVAALERSHPLT